MRIKFGEFFYAHLNYYCSDLFFYYLLFLLFSVIQGILKNKARILVTHSLQFLNAADNIIILKQVIKQCNRLTEY